MINRIRYKLQDSLPWYMVGLVIFGLPINILLDKWLNYNLIGAIIMSFILAFVYSSIVFAGSRE